MRRSSLPDGRRVVLLVVCCGSALLPGCGDSDSSGGKDGAPRASVLQPERKPATKTQKKPGTATSAAPTNPQIRVDEQGRKWIGNVPLDIWFDDPLGVASQDQIAVATPATPSTPASASPEPPSAPEKTPVPPQTPQAGGADWQQLIPAAVVEAEVKNLRNQLADSLQSLGQFKREFQSVQWDGAALAAIGGIAGRHPEPIGWKDKSHYVRQIGTDLEQAAQETDRAAFDKASVLAEQLQVLLSGGNPADLPADVAAEVPFSESADRYGVMKRIDEAHKHLKSNVNTDDRLKSQKESAIHEAAIIAAFAEAIREEGYLSADEEQYQEYARTLRDAAVGIREAAEAESYADFSKALDTASKSCNECHLQYRFE